MNIPGPAGSLEAWLERPAGATASPTRVAVLCHPHPLYGGNMHDGVLDAVARALLGADIACLRFNFRGVGASAGSHSGGPGERLDLGAAIDWVQGELTPQSLWLAGYSFGSSVVWDYLVAGASTPSIEHAFLIAPPTAAMAFPQGAPGCPADAIAGGADHFVDAAKLATLESVTAHVLPGADHFFSGQHRAFADTLREVIFRRAEPRR
ncbi:MAG: alpha/beta hydrolase [Pseudomonadales bacterium]